MRLGNFAAQPSHRRERTKKPRGVSHAQRGSYLLVEVSQSQFKETSAQLPKLKGSAFAIARALREPDEFPSTALTQGRFSTGDNHVASALDSVSPQAAGVQNRREKFRDQRSRNVLEHRPSARRITSLINRSVRARTSRCRTATLAQPMSPDDNTTAEASLTRGSARTCSRRFSDLRKTSITASPNCRSNRRGERAHTN